MEKKIENTDSKCCTVNLRLFFLLIFFLHSASENKKRLLQTSECKSPLKITKEFISNGFRPLFCVYCTFRLCIHATRVCTQTNKQIYLLFFCVLNHLPFRCMHKMVHLFVQRIFPPSRMNDVIHLFDRDFFLMEISIKMNNFILSTPKNSTHTNSFFSLSNIHFGSNELN